MGLLGMSYMIPKTLILLIFLFKHVDAFVSKDSSGYHYCRNGTLDSSQENKLSTTSLLSDLVTHSWNSSFYYSSSNASGSNQTEYGLFYCTANIVPNDCHTCVQKAVSDSQLDCPSYKGAVFFYESCTLRYSNVEVHATPATSDGACLTTSGLWNSVSYTGFNDTLDATLSSVIKEAAYGSGAKGYAYGEASLQGTSKRLYALGQCTPDILGSPCEECLDSARLQIPDCSADFWGVYKTVTTVFLPSCQLGYEVKYPSSGASHGTLSYSLGKTVRYVMIAMAGTALALH